MTIDDSPSRLPHGPQLSPGRDATTETVHESVILPPDLSAAQMRELRVWSNKLYALLDTESPEEGVLEGYRRVQTELNRRESALEHPSVLANQRLRFRDNRRAGRFELHNSGAVAAFLPYSLHEDRIILLETTVHASYRGSDLQTRLIMQVLENADQRRLSVVAFCRYTQEFLKAFPRFQSLVAEDRLPGQVLGASGARVAPGT